MRFLYNHRISYLVAGILSHNVIPGEILTHLTNIGESSIKKETVWTDGTFIPLNIHKNYPVHIVLNQIDHIYKKSTFKCIRSFVQFPLHRLCCRAKSFISIIDFIILLNMVIQQTRHSGFKIEC